MEKPPSELGTGWSKDAMPIQRNVGQIKEKLDGAFPQAAAEYLNGAISRDEFHKRVWGVVEGEIKNLDRFIKK